MRPFILYGLVVLVGLVAQQPALAAGEPGAASQSDTMDAERCMALTVYWEARSEGVKGMTAVAMVVLNRVKSPDFPDTVCTVVHQGGEAAGCQFSYWCDGKGEAPENHETWTLAEKTAAKVLAKRPAPDPTHGALFYHTADSPTPWTVPRKRTAKIKGHIYYR